MSAKLNHSATSLLIGPQQVPLVFARHPRARRYVLRLRRDGAARVTIPRGGSIAEGRAFAERNLTWLAPQLERARTPRPEPDRWRIGSNILFRGERVALEPGFPESPGTIRLGSETFPIDASSGDDLRPALEAHWRRMAERELPPRVFELAALHQLTVRRVTVRNQKSRWGSCSIRGTISLNWRLIQTPGFVRDYLILHELMHLRQMNHSERFWREVARVCPEYRAAERWLRQHARLLRG